MEVGEGVEGFHVAPVPGDQSLAWSQCELAPDGGIWKKLLGYKVSVKMDTGSIDG